MNLPSKELLSEMFNIEVCTVSIFDNLIHMETANGYIRMNIYELMHELKLYSLDRDYKLLSSPTAAGGMCTSLHKLRKQRKTFTASTEVEAVVQACEWIRNNR